VDTPLENLHQALPSLSDIEVVSLSGVSTGAVKEVFA